MQANANVMPSTPPPDDVDEPQNQTTGVRRHHTISASSRRNKSSIDDQSTPDTTTPWNDRAEALAAEQWQLAGAGPVGSGLHRQSSLPSRYIHRNLSPPQSATGRRSGTHTPRTLNSLTAITAEHGLEGEVDEAEWEREIPGWQGEEEHNLPSPPQHSQDSSPSLPSPDYQNVIDPQIAAANAATSGGVRRHASLTYGAQQAKQRAMTGNSQPLKRSGTMLATAPGRSPQPPQDIQDEEEEEEAYITQSQVSHDEYVDQISYPQLEPQVSVNPTYGNNRGSPWSPNKDWRNNQYSNAPQRQQIPGQGQIDDIQRALANLDMSQSQLPSQSQQPQQGLGQPPRFSQVSTGSGMLRDSRSNPHLRQDGYDPRTITSSFMSPIGQGPGMATPGANLHRSPASAGRRSVSSSGQDEYDLPPVGDRSLRSRNSNPNLQYGSDLNAYPGGPMPPVPSIPNQYINQNAGQPPRLGYGMDPGRGGVKSAGIIPGGGPGGEQAIGALDVPTLIATKGYNPIQFDCSPPDARYFVIKSYTEDDVHKSLKYEIWSSTDPGNKRLDKAFKDCAGRGRIFLFFSVNASGHFCGIAEMLTPLDYTRSSTVWASDKWKGVFKVRWIFVRDIPNSALRHIKLMNTQERKPVTNSRDTQELLPEAGQEMLRIFHTHTARTSLLQDFAFYELQAMQKTSPGTSVGAMSESVSPQPGSPTPSHGNIHHSPPQSYQQQHSFASAAYQPQQYVVGGGNGGQGYSHPQAMRSVLRDQSGGLPHQDQVYDGRF